MTPQPPIRFWRIPRSPRRHGGRSLVTVCFTLWLTVACQVTFAELPAIKVAEDGRSFVHDPGGAPFVPWGVNYDHDRDGRLLDEYWHDDWQTVVEDFREIKSLGANCVRIHLQLGKFMDEPHQPKASALRQLAKLVQLAEDTGLYLDVTGLACYHKANIPAWYDALEETQRWSAQASFWRAVASTCQDSPAIFCYDLMNEPIVGGPPGNRDWLAGEPLGGNYFVQRIALEAGGRSPQEVAEQWVKALTTAIRQEDARHLITVGVIPWAHVWPNAKPLFYSPGPARHLDFVSVHFYPQAGQVEQALAALRIYQIGKPLLVEEMFPLKCSIPELLAFVDGSRDVADGWISFYWGQPAAEYDRQTIAGSITAEWLDAFARQADSRAAK